MTAADTAPDDDDRLTLDDLEEGLSRFRLLTGDNDDEAEQLLQRLGATSDVDRDIVDELSSMRVLARPERFWAAHVLAIRSLEVLDRNGTRGVKPKVIGPLEPIAAFLVQLVAGFVVKSHQRQVLDAMGKLYASREAMCARDAVELEPLRRARSAVDRIAPRFKQNPIAIPTFLLGGAFVSSAVTSVVHGVTSAKEFKPFLALIVLLTFAVFFAIAWSLLRGAAVARRRIVLTTERPLEALWQTIGRCGTPPHDQSRQLLIFSLVVTVLAWIVIPAGLLFGAV